MLVARQAGNAFCAASAAAWSSSSVLWGTRVTSLLVAGSGRSIQVVALEETNSLLMKLVVSMGLAMGSWVVGYCVAVVAAEVVAEGWWCWVVAWNPRVFTGGVGALRVEAGEAVVRVRDSAAAVSILLVAAAPAKVMRGELEAWRAGMDRARDRWAAMVQ